MKEGCIFFLLFFSTWLGGQQSNYFTNVGSTESSLWGVPAISMTRTSDAVFINPASLPHIQKTQIDVSANAYSIEYLRGTDALGTGLHVQSVRTNNHPTVISGKIPFLFEKTGLHYAVVQKNVSNVIFDQKIFSGLTRSDGQEQQYVGLFNYDSRIYDLDAHLGMGKKLNETFSVGASFAASLLFWDYYLKESAYLIENNSLETIVQSDLGIRSSLVGSSGFFKIGVKADLQPFQIDMTVKTPTFYLYGDGYYQLEAFEKDANLANNQLIIKRENDIRFQRRRPASIALSLSSQLTEKTAVAFAGEYYFRINDYKIISLEKFFDNESVFPFEQNETNEYNLLEFSQPVFNWGMGLTTRIWDYPVMCSFNYSPSFKNGNNERSTEGIYFKTLDIDIYTLGAGIKFPIKEGKSLTLGLLYSFTDNQQMRQFQNFSYNEFQQDLFGPLNQNMTVRYQKIALLVGYSFYNISNEEGELEKDQRKKLKKRGLKSNTFLFSGS